MALRDPKRCGSWAWFWLVESAQRLGKICLQSKEIGPEMTACVRFSIGSLLLNCASVKDVYAHKYLLKSFSHFQAAIERRMRKGLTRRIDAEIVLNEQSMVAIVNMATCFLELRQMDKCTALICQARLLLGKSTILDELSKHYLSAFIDYFDGVNDFERTSPLHSKLNAGSVILNARELRELYDSALEKLTRSAYRLRQSFSKSTIFASTLTMLGIVTANRTAEFNDTSLAYLQEAVQVEMALSQRSNTMRYLLQTISVAAGLFENDESAIALRWKELHSSVKSLHHNDLSATKEEHPIAVLLRFWSDNWRSARCLMNNSRKLSNELRGAFEASAAWFHLGAVLDSSLAEVCVDLNELLPTVMYYNMMQLEDQEEKALNCLRACLKIQRNLIANGCATSCWAWRSIDVARKLAVYFATSDRQSEWSGIVTAADAILEMSRDCSVETRSLLLGDDAIWTELRLGDRFVAERLVDPIIDWEGKQHLRETCEAMFGRVYPEDNLPTYTEIMCYSHYLMKLWNAHENVCDSEWIYLCVPKCRMTRTSNNIPRRNDFLNGLNEYTLAAPRDKQKILRRLQINHEQLLQMCEPAQLIDSSYGRDTEC
uniref:CHAT domain-containing protein n=1 Tax=Macrostomum lignano TaxID=282301 RepID=A0A1I8GMU4_9PLAT